MPPTRYIKRYSAVAQLRRVDKAANGWMLALDDLRVMIGQPDFSIWAGEQRVGRIYRKHRTGGRELWFWGINTVICDLTVGVPTHGGEATTFEDARARLREAFDHWLMWARAIPRGDLRYPRISEQLKKMGAL